MNVPPTHESGDPASLPSAASGAEEVVRAAAEAAQALSDHYENLQSAVKLIGGGAAAAWGVSRAVKSMAETVSALYALSDRIHLPRRGGTVPDADHFARSVIGSEANLSESAQLGLKRTKIHTDGRGLWDVEYVHPSGTEFIVKAIWTGSSFEVWAFESRE